MKSAWNCFGPNLQCNVQCAVLRHRQQKLALFANAFRDNAEGVVLYELVSQNAITGRGWRTILSVMFLSSLQFPGPRLLTLWNCLDLFCIPVIYSGWLLWAKSSTIWIRIDQWVEDIGWHWRSWNVAFTLKLQYKWMLSQITPGNLRTSRALKTDPPRWQHNKVLSPRRFCLL